MGVYECVLFDARSGAEQVIHTTAPSERKARSNFAWRLRRYPSHIHIATIKEVN